MIRTMKNNLFWNVKTEGQKSRIDLFGYVGGSKEYNDGFNEEDFLNEFRAIPADNELEISINSPGGSVFTALSITSILQEHKGAITIRVNGVAMSAATIITSTPNAKVIMPKGSMMMIHKVSSIAWGNADDMRKMAEDMEAIEQNIINMYVAKTGRTEEEIREKVNAETYFSAEQAVEFGLADEIDDSTTLKNSAVDGETVLVNGQPMSASFFKHAPEGFIAKAESPKATAIHNQANKEEKPMTLEELKAEHPELVEAIRAEALKEGAKNECTRIQAIYALGITGHDDLVADAIQNGKTDGELAVAVMKADNAKKTQIQNAREEDAKPLDNVAPVGNEGLMPGEEQRTAEAKEEADVIAAAVKGFKRK